jgi:hypothetical protein
MAVGLCNRPHQDGQGYVSGAVLGGYVAAPGDGRRHCGKRLEPMSRKMMQGVPPSTNSPDCLSIRPGERKGNTQNWGIRKS